MTVERLLESFKAIGFTEYEIETLCGNTYERYCMEKYFFWVLYSQSPLDYKPRAPQSEEEVGSVYPWSWALPRDVFPKSTYIRFLREGITTVGILQMMTEERLREISGIGGKTLDAVRNYLEPRGLRLTRPAEATRSRAMKVFRGKLYRIPIDYLTACTGISIWPLEVRGIFRVWQLENIPKRRLLTLPFDKGRFDNLSPKKIEAIERELTALGLSFKS